MSVPTRFADVAATDSPAANALHDSHVDAWRDARRAHARQFLARLDPEAERFTFQTFDDTPAKRGSLARVMHGDFDSLAEWLDGQNDWRAGVFVTVNATDGKGRQEHNIERVRAVFVDLDGAPLAPVLAGGLEPHIVCESSPGRFHAYWLTDDCPLDQFKRVQLALAGRFGSDPSVHDLPRVMRLPGFRHFKKDAQTCTLLDGIGTTAPPYALAEIVGGLGLDLDAPEDRRPARPNGDGGMIEPGNRHSHLFASGRSMAKRGLSREAVRAALAAENAARCNPPVADADIDDLARRAFAAKDAQGWRDGPPRDAKGADGSAHQRADDSGPAWPDPLPIVATIAAEPYPLDALPATIRAAVEEVRGFTKAPIAMVASSALAALSVAIQAYVDAQRADKLRGPVGLFLLTIADSGERKSTCDKFFSTAIHDYQAQQAEAAKPELAKYRADIDAWKAKRDALMGIIRTKATKDEPTARKEQALRDLESDKPEPPRVPKLLRGDDTPENLAFALMHEWPSGGVLSSEAGSIFGAHGMGRESIMRNLSLLNILWDGGTLAIGRRTTDSFTVQGARLTMALQIQETTIRAFFDRSDGLPRGIGFLARCLVSWPESTQGYRPFTEAPATWPALASFNRRIAALLEQPAPIVDDGTLSPMLLTLAPDAKAAWIAFHDAIESELRTGGELYDVRDVASKTADNAARLGALLQVFEHGAGVITRSSFEAASRIAAWHLNEARRFFGELALPTELANAARLDAWLLDYCRRECTTFVPRRTVQQFGPSGLRDKAAIDAAVRELEGQLRARLTQDGRRKDIRVNPALMEGGAR
jgi:hypothetical protein